LNYRHAFHAGNFADVMKHALLTRILVHLRKKTTPFFVLDTHAGCGVYDLTADAATRTGEWQGGIGRLDPPFAAAAEALIAPYRAALAAVRARHGASTYPGSPLLVREFLRPGDRALAVELHPEDFAALAETISRAGRIKALNLDGWTALNANIPPKERRGLVLIDPPYETPDEMRRLVDKTARAHAKWPAGIFALWYPLKDVPAVERLAQDLKATGIRKMLRLELGIDRPKPDVLHGSGLVVINPPFTLADEARVLLPALAERMAKGRQSGFRVDWLAGET
jgi:23S rRNA (adenine2030-N6)-methyltransferase